ncbi:MAG: PQQ-binding-like beta-propeller repeat protein [Methanoregula sp.]|nr:PQQ-binding-like beta-propeller repeat protein [Methanoregula sp.]
MVIPVSATDVAMYRGNEQHTGVYSTGGIAPGNNLLWKIPVVDPTGDPVVKDGIVYVGNLSGSLLAANASTGKLVWNAADRDTCGTGQAALGTYSTPLVWNGMVYYHYLTPGGNENITVRNARDGKPADGSCGGHPLRMSNTRHENNVHSSPVLYNASRNHIAVGADDDAIWVGGPDIVPYDWFSDLNGPIHTSPALHNNVLFFGDEVGYVYAAQAYHFTNYKPVWKVKIGNQIRSSPAVANGIVYVGNETGLLALNEMTGTEIWFNRMEGGVMWSSPSVANGMVYAMNGNGTVDAIDSAGGTRMWRKIIKGASTPTIADGVLYLCISQPGALVALDPGTGNTLWTYHLPSDIGTLSSPVIDHGVVYFTAEYGPQNGFLYAVGGQKPQPPVIEWQKAFGGSNGYTQGEYVVRTSDNGIIVGGQTSASNGDLTGLGFHGLQDIVVAKYRADNSLQWAKCYGGSDGSSSLQQILELDDGYLLIGKTRATKDDVAGAGHHGTDNDDIWLVKIDKSGNISPGWSKCFGGTQSDEPKEAIQNLAKGFVITGITSSNDGDFAGLNHGGDSGTSDAFFMVLDQQGNIVQSGVRCFGGSKNDAAVQLLHAIDGSGFYVIGTTVSNDGDVANKNHGGDSGTEDLWVFKVDTLGNLLWSSCYGSTGNEESSDIQTTADGNYVLSGWTDSKDAIDPLFQNHGNAGTKDLWILKIDPRGGLITSSRHCFGGAKDDWGASLRPMINGVIVLGTTRSNDGDVKGMNAGGDTGTADLLLMKLDLAGNPVWISTYGGSGDDFGHQFGIQNQPDPAVGYIIGTTTSTEIPGYHGRVDMWIVKLRASAGDELW